MNKLERDIFDDFILCFFGKERDLENDYWRSYFIHGDTREGCELTGYREVFPENEFIGTYYSWLADRHENYNYIEG